jgi:hypothetical protein
MGSPYFNEKEDLNHKTTAAPFWVWLGMPLASFLLVIIIFLIFRLFDSSEWAIHVDGYGNVTYGSWWALFLGSIALALLALFFGQYLLRDFFSLGHWYPQQKAIVVVCYSVGYGALGFLGVNMITAWGFTDTSSAESLMGYGLLGFLLFSILAIFVYTKYLPKAKQIDRDAYKYPQKH